MDITAIHQIFLTCTSVTTDSRNCPQGSLFIALKGESFNGNAFAARALESGSAYAIVDEEAYAPAGDTRYIVVENSLRPCNNLPITTVGRCVHPSSALRVQTERPLPRS